MRITQDGKKSSPIRFDAYFLSGNRKGTDQCFVLLSVVTGSWLSGTSVTIRLFSHQAKLLSQAQALRHEAEMAVNEMEEAAKTQLHNLANQSQVTLSAIEERLTRSRQRLDEFQIVIRVCPSKTFTEPLERTV